MLCSLLPGADLTDAALAARSVFYQYQPDPLHILQESKNGRVLVSKGRAEDVRWCAQVSISETVGVMRKGALCSDSGAPGPKN
jgi:phosphosulfolactate phosphohydrolase-like enzyme